MNFYRFRVFASVARHGSVTKAAEELHCTQPALSQQLKILEDQYGILFKQNGRRRELTAQGRSLLNDIGPLLSQMDELEKKYRGKRPEASSEPLSVGGSDGPSASVLPSLMAKFQRINPRVDLRLNTGSGGEIAELILQRRLDKGVILSTSLPPSLEMEPFRTEILCLFVAATHPLAKKKKIAIEEFATLPLVIRSGRNGHSQTEELLRRVIPKGRKPNVMRCEFPHSVKVAVSEGAGIGILDRDLIQSAVQNGAFKIVQVSGLGLTGQSYIVYSKEKPLSSGARGFLALLRAARDNLDFSKQPRQSGDLVASHLRVLDCRLTTSDLGT